MEENNKTGLSGLVVKISVVIPTHNRCDALEQTLAALARQQFSESWEAIVVNNNCTDQTDEVVLQMKFPVPLRLLHEKKPGASAARNLGGFNANGQYLVFIDNDIITQPDFLSRHYVNLEKFENAWFVGHAENLPELKKSIFGQFRNSLESVKLEGLHKTDGITGQNTSMPKANFVSLEGFDENFHVASGEDRELALRALEAGITIYADHSITVLHNDWAGASIGDYCKRQRVYTQTEPYFWLKYGDKNPRMKLARENSSPQLAKDGIRLFTWKLVKSVLGSKPGQQVIIAICEFFEKFIRVKPIVFRLYKLAIAGSIYKGFQEGMRTFNKTKTEQKSAVIQH
ncbi:MAG: glycosyltransferase [Chitinophagales bacterium]|nr:glycosyltransferase [Chitinophagales bacterium]